MQNLSISNETLEKLRAKHNVTRREVEQCFENIEGRILEEQRTQHKTNPTTRWFLAKTNRGRVLKVVYIQTGVVVEIKTCYPPNEDERYIYFKYGAVSY